MVPICETDFEARHMFSSNTLLKQDSATKNKSNKNDFIVDYDKYKIKKHSEKQKLKLAKSLKSCCEKKNDRIDSLEKRSLRSNYDGNLIPSDTSINGLETMTDNILHRRYSYSKNSLSPSMCSKKTGNGNNQGNFLIPDNASSRIDLAEKKPIFYSNYSLVSNMTNTRLSNLTTDYKINYNFNDNMNSSKALRNQLSLEKVPLKQVTENQGENKFFEKSFFFVSI